MKDLPKLKKGSIFTLKIVDNAYWSSMNGKLVVVLDPADKDGIAPNNILVALCNAHGKTDKSLPFWTGNKNLKPFPFVPIIVDQKVLTDQEKQSIKALNFIAKFDGIIQSEDDIKYILKQGIDKFIPKKRQHLVSITESAYPIRIKY